MVSIGNRPFSQAATYVDMSNPKTKYLYRKPARTEISKGHIARSSNTITYQGMTVRVARSLEINDPVSVICPSGMRCIGVVTKISRAEKPNNFWVEVAYHAPNGTIQVERIAADKKGKKMTRLVEPTGRTTISY